jgi:hypothetical protein
MLSPVTVTAGWGPTGLDSGDASGLITAALLAAFTRRQGE